MLKSNVMEFQLQDEYINDILFAMEDQNNTYLYDSMENTCVLADSIDDLQDNEFAETQTDQRYYDIPEWDSISGFRMMDRFASTVKNPLVREDLRMVLDSGQGVFRAFKNIIKSNLDLERQWYQFKERHMRSIVTEWYNTLRVSWGLERIGLEPEETEDLVMQDFVFKKLDPQEYPTFVAITESWYQEIKDDIGLDLSIAIKSIYTSLQGSTTENTKIFVAETSEGELAGISFSQACPEQSVSVAQIPLIFVLPEYRGMGVAQALLEKTIELWTKKDFCWILGFSPLMPSFFEPLLQRLGFVKKDHLYILELSIGDL